MGFRGSRVQIPPSRFLPRLQRGKIVSPVFRRRCSLWSQLTVKSRLWVFSPLTGQDRRFAVLSWTLVSARGSAKIPPSGFSATVCCSSRVFIFPAREFRRAIAYATRRGRSADRQNFFLARPVPPKKNFLTTRNQVQYFVLSSERLSSEVSLALGDSERQTYPFSSRERFAAAPFLRCARCVFVARRADSRCRSGRLIETFR
jgi:hypothetical protein